jgi:hypothetical protein
MTPELADRWRHSLSWLDDWFEPGRASRHGFDPADQELFEELARAWRQGTDKIAALEATSARFGRDRVLAVLDRVCADETASYWQRLAAREGRSLADLERLLWQPLPALGFDVEFDRAPDSLRITCRRCPHNDLAEELGAKKWLYALVCSTDFHVAGAFDGISFQRTRTLMQGDDCCDHTYVAVPGPSVRTRS